MANIGRWRVHASLALIVLIVLATGGFDCGSGGGGNTTPPTVGSISVSTGFGAVSNPPYQCQGSGNVTITPQSLTGTAGSGSSQTKPFTYSGYSASSPPACKQDLIFTDLRPGSWQATNGGGTCPATVTAGQMATVKIYNNVCQ